MSDTTCTSVDVPHWLLLSDVSAPALRLYVTLAVADAEGLALTSSELSTAVGMAHRQSVSRYISELIDLGAIESAVEIHATGRRNKYVVHQRLPKSHAGATSLRHWYDERLDGQHPSETTRRRFPDSPGRKHLKALITLGLAECAACGADRDLQVDHVVAVACGGENEAENLQILCRRCNVSKGKRDNVAWLTATSATPA